MNEQDHNLNPASTNEVVNVVRQAISDGRKLRLRGVPSEAITDDVHNLHLYTMASVVDYPARDMTITVQAGMPFEELQKILAAENQQLPIDVFNPSASIGSIIASDVAGPRQYGYGTLRDYVIGIEAVDGQGRVFHAGGRVVKNVAGYDLCRLMVGSRGMLGVITQVTFKLKPLPEHSMLRTFRFDKSDDFNRAMERLNASAATPVVLDFTYASNDLAKQAVEDPTFDRKEFPYSLHIGVEGTEATCRWQLDQLRSECDGASEFHPDEDSRGTVETLYTGIEYARTDVIIRCLPSKVAAIAHDLAERGYSSLGHAGNGIIHVGDQSTREMCEEIAIRHDAIVSQWDVDHPANTSDPLTTRLRQTFDPHSVFIQ